jgi:fructan beta-fructosidase
LVYYKGEYHLFYQHNPNDIVWGPMYWGHAVSRDLINWQHLPIALYPDDIGDIFSGSAVIDWKNTAGFGKEAMVAIFTHDAQGRQHQSLAYSLDRGRTWQKYQGNPIIEVPKNLRHFRDPKVFWYGDAESGHWMMAVAGGNVILFFSSPDLKTWKPTGGFGFGYGSTQGVWETPDLFELPVDGGPDTRWVLSVGVGNGGPAEGSGTQYFIGDFDGRNFTSENPKEKVLWADFGADFYAAQSWSNEPGSRRLWIGWMNNWRYANHIPTSTWRGALSIPREVGLTRTPDGIRLIQKAIKELEELRANHYQWRDENISSNTDLLTNIQGETIEIVAEFQVEQNMDADRLGLRVRVGAGEMTTIGYGAKTQTLFVDRTKSGQSSFDASFASVHIAELKPKEGFIRLHIFVDRSSVEVFANDGIVVFSEQIFPSAQGLGLEIFADGGDVLLSSLDIFQLEAAELKFGS